MSFIMVWLSAKRSTCYAKHDKYANSYKIKYGGYLIILTCGVLGIFRYKKSEVDIQINTEA